MVKQADITEISVVDLLFPLTDDEQIIKQVDVDLLFAGSFLSKRNSSG